MDIRLSYTDIGGGEPLILLHGNGGSREYFANQMDFFSSEFRVIAIDTRGHGRSPRGEKPFTFEQFAEDLKDFMDSISLKKAHILGCSDGGNLALTFALRYPDYVDKLIVNSANLTPSGLKAQFVVKVAAEYAIASVKARSKKKEDIYKKEMLGLMVNQPNIKASDLSKLSMPTLVIAGNRDIIKTSHTKLIAKSIPNSTLSILDGTHCISAEDSEVFNKAVYEFLKK